MPLSLVCPCFPSRVGRILLSELPVHSAFLPLRPYLWQMHVLMGRMGRRDPVGLRPHPTERLRVIQGTSPQASKLDRGWEKASVSVFISVSPLPQMPKGGPQTASPQEILGATVKTASHLLPKSQARPQCYGKDEPPAWGFPSSCPVEGRQELIFLLRPTEMRSHCHRDSVLFREASLRTGPIGTPMCLLPDPSSSSVVCYCYDPAFQTMKNALWSLF